MPRKVIWKDVEGYEGLYKVSNIGIVINKDGKIMNQKPSKGYEHVGLTKDKRRKTFKVHRLVAQAFIENAEDKPIINHIDGEKSSNQVYNLEWSTPSENMHHAYEHGLKVASEKAGKPKKKVAKILNGVIKGEYNSISEAAKSVGINHSTLSVAVNKKYKTAGGYKWITI